MTAILSKGRYVKIMAHYCPTSLSQDVAHCYSINQPAAGWINWPPNLGIESLGLHPDQIL